MGRKTPGEVMKKYQKLLKLIQSHKLYQLTVDLAKEDNNFDSMMFHQRKRQFTKVDIEYLLHKLVKDVDLDGTIKKEHDPFISRFAEYDISAKIGNYHDIECIEIIWGFFDYKFTTIAEFFVYILPSFTLGATISVKVVHDDGVEVLETEAIANAIIEHLNQEEEDGFILYR